MRRLFFVLAAVALLGAGCAKPPPATLEEIRNTEVDGPITFEPKKFENPNDIFVEPPASAPESPARPREIKPLPGVLPPAHLAGKKARIKTAKGEIVVELLGRDAPIAVSSFIWLSAQKFYDGLTFHRMEPGFVVQGGDPRGDGTGGPGYTFPDERVRKPYRAGTVAMANSGPNTNGSQFFIVLQDQPNLPPRYTIFGTVVEGLEVVRALAVGDIMQEVSVE